MLVILQTVSDVSIRNIAVRCTNLKQLCVSKCAELSDNTLIALANNNPLLSTLEVAGCHQFTDTGFQALGRVSCVGSVVLEFLNNDFSDRTASI